MPHLSPDIESRRIEAEASPIWSGDLDDDCSARWAGFLLRAEAMDKEVWWCAVTDLKTGLIVEDSAAGAGVLKDGLAARRKYEEAVRRFLSVSTS